MISGNKLDSQFRSCLKLRKFINFENLRIMCGKTEPHSFHNNVVKLYSILIILDHLYLNKCVTKLQQNCSPPSTGVWQTYCENKRGTFAHSVKQNKENHQRQYGFYPIKHQTGQYLTYLNIRRHTEGSHLCLSCKHQEKNVTHSCSERLLTQKTLKTRFP